jgi:major vault protein
VCGPNVVFPEPTEEFAVSSDSDGRSSRKFKAIEMNPKTGIHLKVIADYEDADGTAHKIGDELFITGEEQSIYFPRKEHAVIKYGGQDKYFGVAIPAGEARYVLNRLTGNVRLEKGPSVFLPDPREEVVVRRLLDLKHCNLLYPSNREALSHNETILNQIQVEAAAAAAMGEEQKTRGALTKGSRSRRQKGGTFSSAANTMSFAASASMVDADSIGVLAIPDAAAYSATTAAVPEGFHGDDFERKTKYTPPRTVTLNTKYEGAVTVDVWEGYAVMLTSKSGNRRVVVGPQTALFEYDEVPHVLTMSTGKPKNTDSVQETVYLRVKNNYVTDIVTAETKDFCNVTMKLSYRVNFVGDNPESWFRVENYVKFLCDHMRSVIRNFAKQQTVENFYQNASILLRNLIIGEQSEEGVRTGRTFDENDMHIYDVEILDVSLDNDIEGLLVAQQRDTIRQALALNKGTRDAEFTRKSEALKREMEEEKTETLRLLEGLKRSTAEEQLKTSLASVDAQNATSQRTKEHNVALQELVNQAAAATRSRMRLDEELELDMKEREANREASTIMAEAEATKEKAKAITPDLISALQGFSDMATLKEVAKALGPTQMLKIAGGESVVDVLSRLLKGTDIGNRLPMLAKSGSNGSSAIDRIVESAEEEEDSDVTNV